MDEAEGEMAVAEAIIKDSEGKEMEAQKRRQQVFYSLPSPVSRYSLVYAKHNFEFNVG